MPSLLSNSDSRESTASQDVFLLYHSASGETGERLGQYLGVPHGTECNGYDYDHVIRWGARQRVPGANTANIVQAKDAIAEASQKFNALQELEAAGVNVPTFTRDRDELGPTPDARIQYPALGRAESHTQGSDINLIMQWRDAYLTNNHHFVDYIPTELEYRMHVIGGEVIKVHEKRLRTEEDNHAYIRNHETGWVFVNPREDPPSADLAIDAIDALGLNYGAVDVIRAEEDGEEYVLEVNTAPSLDENNLERYANKLASWIGLDQGDLAGHDAVDWSEDDEEDDDDS